MRSSINITKAFVFLAFSVNGILNVARAQSNPATNADLNRIESNIKEKQTLREAQAELQAIYTQAKSAGDILLQARSLNYLIVVRDQLTQDTLNFKNSAIIDTLLAEPETAPKLKSILYVMQARRLLGFNQMGRRVNVSAYRVKNTLKDYTILDNYQRNELANKYLDSALTNARLFSKAESVQLKWLCATPDVFLFEPRFADLVFAEKTNQALNHNVYNDDSNKMFINMLGMSAVDFARQLTELPVHKENVDWAATFNAYSQWMVFNNDYAPIKAFIESLARKTLFGQLGNDSVAKALYTKYLLRNTNSPYPELKAHVIYQLCLLYNQEGHKYNNFNDVNWFISLGTDQMFDPQYQYLPAKALELYEQNSAFMEKYPSFKQVLDIMARQIKARGLRIDMDDVSLPGKAISFKATYKNTDTLYYKVIKIPAGQPDGKTAIVTTDGLLKTEGVLSGKFALPLPADDNVHASYLKLDKLPVGRYQLLAAYNPIGAAGDTLNSLCFNVTNIIAVNTDERVFVLNRETGYPLTGAHIKAFNKRVEVKGGVGNSVGSKGYIVVKKDIADSISISYKGDTLGYDINMVRDYGNDDVFDKDEYDDLIEFYDENARMEIFTDRAIYRPGQTVHYKVIFLTKNPVTGQTILLNKQNLGGRTFKKLLNTWQEDDGDLMELKDAFGKTIDSAHIEINEFGSFAGNFILPKNSATGSWQIDGMFRTNYQNDGSFQVEEYKRPTIEMKMEGQKKVFLPGEPFTIKLKLRSYNGSDLGNIPVKYTLARSGNLPKNGGLNKTQYATEQLIDTTGYTNKDGELFIAVKDTALLKFELSEDRVWSYSYAIDASAVDLTGESTELSDRIEVSSRPVIVNLNIAGVLDRQKIPDVTVSTSDRFAGGLSRMVNVKIYKTDNPDKRNNYRKEVDQWYYSESEWYKWFPENELKAKTAERHLTLDTTVNTNDLVKLKLKKEMFSVGFYEVEASTYDGARLMGKTKTVFSLFDSGAGEWADDGLDHVSFNFVKAGDQITWYGGSRNESFTVYRAAYFNKANKSIVRYENVDEMPGLRKWKYSIPNDARGRVLLTRISVRDNQISYGEKEIYINSPEKADPQIVVERYRRVLAPGAEEKFTISVKVKEDKIAAELLTTLYDASLDKLEEHQWQLPRIQMNAPYAQTNWNRVAFYHQSAQVLSADMKSVNLFRLSAIDIENGVYGLSGRVAGLNVTNVKGLEEVVVVGYGTVKKNVNYSVTNVTLRGNSSIDELLKKIPGFEVDAAGNVITLGRTATQVRLNGKDFIGGDLQTLASALPAEIIDHIQVIDDYGNQSNLSGSKGLEANKVLNLTISDDGSKINVILAPPAPVIKIRKDFNETAFFFPQVHADKDGYFSFNFTMPETATEWNWKMLAHTQDARFAYLERQLQTQLNLMVQPNMPRLLYQGDKIQLQSRVSNLDTLAMQGKASCKIEDAVTGEDITAMLLAVPETDFTLDKKSSGSVAFALNVPAGQLNPLKIVVSVVAGGATDAEEHIIPVLTSKVFIRQSQPIRFDDKTSVTLNKPKLPADAINYGVGLTITQKPQAALIYALPWLANYSFDCAEQTFNKLRAQVTALALMRKDTSVQNSFERVKANATQLRLTTEGLPDELADETMPWLKLGANAEMQQKQLFRLLDTVQTKAGIEKHIQKLQKLQKPDGGLTWFEGGESNAYISAYVLAGFGQLKQFNYTLKQTNFIAQLINYNQNNLLSGSIKNTEKLYLLYALSYFNNQNPPAEDQLARIKTILQTEWAKVGRQNLQQQALLIVNTLRYTSTKDSLYAKAGRQLENIRQMAIDDAANGLRWKEISDSEEMNSSAEETMAILAEAFEQSGKYTDVQGGIIKWLLTAKQQEHWQTTKGSAAAINMLYKEKGAAMDVAKGFSAEVGGKQIAVSDALLGGKAADFYSVSDFPAAVALKQNGSNATGALTWYYFATPNGLDTLNKAVKIKREYFIYRDNHVMEPVQTGTVLKSGDKVQVVLTVEAAASLQYVHINDPRAALFEPKETSSGYKYQSGTGYYQSIRDTGINLFAEAIPRGTTGFTYDVVVAHSGTFNSGPATLQCMYQPAVTAYSNTQSFNAE